MGGKSISLSTKERDDLIARVSRDFLKDANEWKDVYDEIEDGYNYLSGNQYSAENRQWYETVRRPTKSFNLYFNLFNNILGDFFQNEQRTKVHTLPPVDPQIAPQLAEHVENMLISINQANEVTTKLAAAQAAGLNKLGVLFPRWSDELRIEDGIVISDVDEFEFMFEPTASDYFQDDATRQIQLQESSLFDLDEPVVHFTCDTVSHKVRDALKRAGLYQKGRTIHAFRHTFATETLKQSNIRVTQEALDHKNISTTEIYTHIVVEQKKKAVASLSY